MLAIRKHKNKQTIKCWGRENQHYKFSFVYLRFGFFLLFIPLDLFFFLLFLLSNKSQERKTLADCLCCPTNNFAIEAIFFFFSFYYFSCNQCCSSVYFFIFLSSFTLSDGNTCRERLLIKVSWVSFAQSFVRCVLCLSNHNQILPFESFQLSSKSFEEMAKKWKFYSN